MSRFIGFDSAWFEPFTKLFMIWFIFTVVAGGEGQAVRSGVFIHITVSFVCTFYVPIFQLHVKYGCVLCLCFYTQERPWNIKMEGCGTLEGDGIVGELSRGQAKEMDKPRKDADSQYPVLLVGFQTD